MAVVLVVAVVLGGGGGVVVVVVVAVCNVIVPTASVLFRLRLLWLR